MKTMKMNMVSLFILTGFLGISLNSNSQDITPDKQDRKEARKAQMNYNFIVLDSLLESRRFVLEADFLQSKYGYMVSVTSTLNFVKVDDTEGVLQTGSESRQGYNGVGGVTAEGSIGDFKISKDFKHLSYVVTFNLLTNLGIFDITLNVSSDNNATATITGSTSGRLTWNGHLVKLNNSSVFKGQNTI
jgi:hypothetical protein